MQATEVEMMTGLEGTVHLERVLVLVLKVADAIPLQHFLTYVLVTVAIPLHIPYPHAFTHSPLQNSPNVLNTSDRVTSAVMPNYT